MISRVTIFSFLLALLLGFGLWRWNLGHRDACSAYLAGNLRAPSKMYVVTGTRTIVVPCDLWLERQSGTVQIVCLVELLFIVTFVLNAAADLLNALGARQRRRMMHI